MAKRTFCDACGAEAPLLLTHKGEDGPDRCAPFGQQGDGMKRQLELRCGDHNIVTRDLCVGCFERVKSLLVEAFPEMTRTHNDR